VPVSRLSIRAPLNKSRSAEVDAGVLVLGGATAAGKSDLAAELAHRLGGAVVCADSRQVYRGLEIGAAQPDDRQRERAPHFLVGFLSPACSYSAGSYGDDARRVMAALRARDVPVVLCGGTGLYLRAALGGLFRENASALAGPYAVARDPAEGSPRARRRARAELGRRWEREGGDALHAELARLDPALARRVHAADRQRVLRGLAFHAATGARLSDAWEAHDLAGPGTRAGGTSSVSPTGNRRPGPPGLRFWLDPPVRELEARIETRLDGMLRRGLVDEARALYERYGADPPLSLNAVGYLELFRHFEGKGSLEDAVTRIRLRTRQYAKRQRTWFRHQDGYVALPADDHALEVLLSAWRSRPR
jgi:tRNA dimethylallyltransferase